MQELIRISSQKFFPDYFRLLRISSTEKDLLFPTQMNPKDRHSTIELSRQYMRITYQGSGKTDSDAASVRSKYAIPSQLGIFYFETTVISKGWEPHSWGYHGDDGNCFNCSGTGKKYGPTFSTNDVVGCGVNFVTKSAFYTKNGVFLGYAFEDMALDKVEVYPCIGLRTPGEVVEVNFGKRRFSFDIDSYIQEQIDTFTTNIQSTISVSLDHSIQIILRHFLFNGHLKPALALAKSVGLVIAEKDLKRCQLKLQIRELLVNCNYETLLDIIAREFSTVDDLVFFSIKCQKFLDMVFNSMSSTATSHNGSNDGMQIDEYDVLKSALDYGQQLQDDYRQDERPAVQTRLIEIFSVLAYPNPLDSPQVSEYFAPSQKEKLFEYVNSELFGEDDMLTNSFKQLQLTLDELEQLGDGSAAFFEESGKSQ